MKTITLEAFKDESTGYLGLGIVGVPRDETTNSASEGLLIAHDLIEHVNGPQRIGGIDDELEALGAIWYVRGQHGELNRNGSGSAYSITQNIASDVVRMFRDHIEGGQYVDYAPPRTRAVLDDESLQQILVDSDETWRNEWYHETRPDEATWQRYRAVALSRMRLGYSKARRRWEPRGRYAANSQLWAIAEACQPYCKAPEFEGMRYTLRYGNGEAHCSEQYAEEY